jgi:hypothetical protein
MEEASTDLKEDKAIERERQIKIAQKIREYVLQNPDAIDKTYQDHEFKAKKIVQID